MSGCETSEARIPYPEGRQQFESSYGTERRTSIVNRRKSFGRSGLALETTWAP